MKKTIPFTKTIRFKTMIAEITDIETKHTLEVKEENSIEGDILVDGKYKMHEASQIEEEFHYSLPFTIEVDNKYDISNCQITISDFYFEIINEEDLKINIELEISNVDEKNLIDEDIIKNHIEKINDLSNKDKLDIDLLESIEEDTVLERNEIVFDSDLDNTLEEELKISKKVFKDKTDIDLEELEENNLFQEYVEKQELNIEKEEINNMNPTQMGSIIEAISETDETFVAYHVYIVRENDTVEEIIEKYKTTREDLSAYNDIENIKLGSKIIIPCNNE
ncbi:MAG: LysM peptidoglycan-binding domain-containing protein [Firmicutes bacterium]|nr:LysM peptidoglycan-binding domain-containing protein [Bacillota bacterium]